MLVDVSEMIPPIQPRSVEKTTSDSTASLCFGLEVGQADGVSLGCSFHAQAPPECRRTEGGCSDMPAPCDKGGKHNSQCRRASLVAPLQGTGEDMGFWQSCRPEQVLESLIQ